MNDSACYSSDHFSRRTLLRAAGASGLLWLTPIAERLARAADEAPRGKPAKSIIVLWLDGGPSQLETFDPHPNSKIADPDSKVVQSAVDGIQLGEGFNQLGKLMPHVALVRSIVSKEGDHERATYNVKNGWRPDSTLIHPSLGAILTHETTDNVEIPRHISILPGNWPARGGFLGDQYDAFKIGDPQGAIPDVQARVSPQRFQQRMERLKLVEDTFAKGRMREMDAGKTLHRTSMNAAQRMMDSAQLKAFDVSLASKTQRDAYGDSAFGRGCLAALRLIEQGVRCVEVRLGGWDTHAKNREGTLELVQILDPAFSQLLRDLQERKLLDSTIVMCGGEFGRTPKINPLGGRDHWPHGFSIALAGGGLRGGIAVGETSPEPGDKPDTTRDVKNPVKIEDVHATVLTALGIDPLKEVQTKVGRPMKFSEGKAIRALLG